MTCGGALAEAVMREGMAGSEFRCNSAAGGGKRTEIPLPTSSAKPIQDTDYNRFMTPRGGSLGAEIRSLPCWQGKAPRGR